MSDIIREYNAVIDNFNTELAKLKRQIHTAVDNRIKKIIGCYLPKNFEFEVTPEKISDLQTQLNYCLEDIRFANAIELLFRNALRSY